MPRKATSSLRHPPPKRGGRAKPLETKPLAPTSPLRQELRQGSLSPNPKLSRTTRRLLFAYEDELERQGASRRFAYQLGVLAVFVLWLRRRGVELQEAWPEDLAAWRDELRESEGPQARVRRFDVVRGLYRFLYCRELLGHDPTAVLDLPKRPRRRRARP
jgi:hypothetical protein